MAEERDPLTEAEKNRLTPDGMSPAGAGYVSSEGTQTGASGTYTAGSKAPAEIQRDIAHTRAEMSETVDAIGARFEPEYLKEQAKDVVRSTARDARSTMIDTIKENPVPSILAGLSLGWLIAKGGDSSGHDRDRRDYEEHYFRMYGRYPDYQKAYVDLRGQGNPSAGAYREYPRGYSDDSNSSSATDEARQQAQHVADQAGDLAHKAGRQAEHVADRATDIAHEAGHQIQEVGHQMEHYGRQATNWLQDQVYRNPLGVGAAALAAGALVGMAVPETHAENRLIGEQAERAKEQARSAAQEKLEQAKDVAAKVADEAADKAEDVVRTAKSEAKKEGLDEPPKVMTSSSGSSSTGGSTSGSTSGSTPGGSTSGGTTSGGTTTGSTSGSSGAASGKTAGTPDSGSGSTSR